MAKHLFVKSEGSGWEDEGPINPELVEMGLTSADLDFIARGMSLILEENIQCEVREVPEN